MTYHSKKAIVSILTSLLVFLYLFIDIQGAGSAGVESLPQLWGVFFLKWIVIEVLAKMVILIVFNILNRLATREAEPSFADERDRMIELKAVRNFCFMFSFGFFVAMGALAIHQPLSVMFNTLAIDFFLSGLVLNLSYIFYYQRGF
ncbi:MULTISPECIES: hypothetical protein [Paenibacillus]|uniref:DUF2178 domain-containing protein n=1 Tax=Paenibacillus agri TaxID=2744309 RepID=A0A850EYH5_9BACL|nr:hypothetical protein [Paenibacillus agri]NUU62881.1 hypothetical protein [Paenibacillus agri]